jgi:hypothetical protein
MLNGWYDRQFPADTNADRLLELLLQAAKHKSIDFLTGHADDARNNTTTHI